jgi:hypothetical protein
MHIPILLSASDKARYIHFRNAHPISRGVNIFTLNNIWTSRQKFRVPMDTLASIKCAHADLWIWKHPLPQFLNSPIGSCECIESLKDWEIERDSGNRGLGWIERDEMDPAALKSPSESNGRWTADGATALSLESRTNSEQLTESCASLRRAEQRRGEERRALKSRGGVFSGALEWVDAWMGFDAASIGAYDIGAGRGYSVWYDIAV